MKIEVIQIGKLVHPEWNPRKATEKEAKDLKVSLEKFGFVDPIIVNRKNNHIVGGNFRVHTAQGMGMTEVPCVFVDLNDEQERELNLRLNRNTGQWDWELLAEFDKNLLLDVGFEEKDLAKYFQLDVVEDEAPEPPAEPKSKPGDLYQLGNHRLLCGDATKKEDVERLMDGQKADMVFTDPPYGYNTGEYAGRSKKFDVIEGNQGDVKRFYEAIPTDVPERYIWGGFPNFVDLPEMPRDVIVWKKNNFGMGRGYRGQYELCFYYGSFDGSDSDVWEQDKDTNYQHPTQKPVALAARAIKNSNPQLVLDIYGGSGSTLIACEQLNRKCYMMEIDPRYVDVIIARWEKFTGKKAEKI